MNIAGIRAAIAAAVSSAMDVQTFGYVPESITPPTFSAGEVEIEYNQSFSTAGLTLITCKGRLYTSRADTASGQSTMDGYLAPTGALSIKAAIESDRTLGGLARTLNVDRIQGYGLYTVGGVDYYGAQYDIRIWAI